MMHSSSDAEENTPAPVTTADPSVIEHPRGSTLSVGFSLRREQSRPPSSSSSIRSQSRGKDGSANSGLGHDSGNGAGSAHSLDAAENRSRTRSGSRDTLFRGSFLNGSTLRETIFGRSRAPDPLEESQQAEFSLTVIDEKGAMAEPVISLIQPTIRWRHWSVAGYTTTAIGVVTVLLTMVPALLFEKLDGYELDPGLVFGSLQTLLLCVVVIITYNGMQSYQAHPNPLILCKCVVDVMLSLRFLLDPFLLQAGVYELKDRDSCQVLSGITQSLFFASECWYFAQIIDLYKALSNPFTSVKADRRKYMAGVIGCALLSGSVTIFVRRFHGFSDGNFCWAHRGVTQERNFWRLNIALWALFYDWMIVFYLAGIAVLIIGVQRLRAGLTVTLETRREMLHNGAISIMSYTVYWTIVFFWYAASFSARTHYNDDGNMQPSKVFRFYSYMLAGRGAIDYYVWFMINRPSLMTKNWLRFSAESADTKFSAQLNEALQRELIFFTIEGMTKAIQLADTELQQKRDRLSSSEIRDNMSFSVSVTSDGTSPTGTASVVTNNRDSMVSNRTLELPSDSDVSVVTITDSHALNAVSASTRSRPSRSHSQGLFARLSAIGAPPGASEQHIKFTPYKSEVFAELREYHGITSESFLKSFESSTKPAISEGASGAFLFFSGDKRFIVKSMAESECRFLCQIAEQYVDYLMASPWSFITKFYGCFRITLYDKKFYFVVMENLFDVMAEGVSIHHRYDIKGSWVNRSYKRPRHGALVKCRHCGMQFRYGGKKGQTQCPNVVGPHEPNVVLKDNDLHTRMRIGGSAGRELFEYLREDSLFLCRLGIMDYSLLLGVTDIEFFVDQRASRSNTVTSVPPDLQSLHHGSHSTHSFLSNVSSQLESIAAEQEQSPARPPAPPHTVSSILHLNSDRLDSSSRGTRRSMRKSERVFGPGYYYIGVIDILQQWNWKKRLENVWKVYGAQCDPEGLSAIDPVRYQQRFEAKLREIISIPKAPPRDAMSLSALGTSGRSMPSDVSSSGPHGGPRRREEGPVRHHFNDALSTVTDDDGDMDTIGNPEAILVSVNRQHSHSRSRDLQLADIA